MHVPFGPIPISTYLLARDECFGERETGWRDDNYYDGASERASVRREGINHLSHSSEALHVCLSAASEKAL